MMETTITIYTQSSRLMEAYEKVKKVVLSCDKNEQIKVARRMVFLFHAKFRSLYFYMKLIDFLNHKEREFEQN